MTQPSDIVLNTDPYMLVAEKGSPGYTRSQDGIDEGRTGRIAQTDFFGGLNRALQLERDRGWDGLKVGPAHGGQGIAPWPNSALVGAEAGTPNSSNLFPFPTAVVRDTVYIGIGQYVYQTVATNDPTWAAPTRVYDAGVGNIVTGLCNYLGYSLIICRGDTADIVSMLVTDNSTSILSPGKRGVKCVSYMGQFIFTDQPGFASGYPNRLWLYLNGLFEERFTDTDIVNLATAQGEVIAATRSALYSFSGSFRKVTVPNPAPPPDDVEVNRWSGELEPYFQHGTATDVDDFKFILGFGGRTYAWIGRSVLEYDPQGDRAGWRDTGLSGVRCHGACVASGYLVVSIVTAQNTTELWAWDGSGWWCIYSEVWNGVNELLSPIPLAGAGAYDLMVFHPFTNVTTLFRLVWRSATQHNYPTTGTYTTSLIDAGERDKNMAWRKIGFVFASPDLPGNPASADSITVALAYSTNNGETFTTPISVPVPGNAMGTNNFEFEVNIASDVAVSPFLMLRVSWMSISDWAPILVGLWAEYEVLDSPARRRRWQFTVQAEDQVIDRDGATLTRTGREQITELWDHWQAGTTVPFRDIDHDAAPTERRVRIVGIEERVPVPHEAGHWGQSRVMLTLVEV